MITGSPRTGFSIWFSWRFDPVRQFSMCYLNLKMQMKRQKEIYKLFSCPYYIYIYIHMCVCVRKVSLISVSVQGVLGFIFLEDSNPPHLLLSPPLFSSLLFSSERTWAPIDSINAHSTVPVESFYCLFSPTKTLINSKSTSHSWHFLQSRYMVAPGRKKGPGPPLFWRTENFPARNRFTAFIIIRNVPVIRISSSQHGSISLTLAYSRTVVNTGTYESVVSAFSLVPIKFLDGDKHVSSIAWP